MLPDSRADYRAADGNATDASMASARFAKDILDLRDDGH